MKSDLEKRLEYVRSQREILQRTEEELQKQLDAEKLEFDFKTKMPVGSVWLGDRAFKVIDHWEKGPVLECHYEFKSLVIYRAHQIVKAAQGYVAAGGWSSRWIDLNRAVEAAEQDGVLQNLE